MVGHRGECITVRQTRMNLSWQVEAQVEAEELTTISRQPTNTFITGVMAVVAFVGVLLLTDDTLLAGVCTRLMANENKMVRCAAKIRSANNDMRNALPRPQTSYANRKVAYAQVQIRTHLYGRAYARKLSFRSCRDAHCSLEPEEKHGKKILKSFE